MDASQNNDVNRSRGGRRGRRGGGSAFSSRTGAVSGARAVFASRGFDGVGCFECVCDFFRWRLSGSKIIGRIRFFLCVYALHGRYRCQELTEKIITFLDNGRWFCRFQM